jgi:hypothetical protein
MSDKESAQNVIDSYRKRQQAAQRASHPGDRAVLLIAGAAAIIFWLTGSNRPSIALFATDTPTPTITPTVTATNTATNTPTVTPTITAHRDRPSRPWGPFVYKVVEG